MQLFGREVLRFRYETLRLARLDAEMTWAEKLIEKGRSEGLVVGKRESVLRVLAAKFGPLSSDVRKRVEAMESGEELDACLEQILTAASLEESGLDA